MYDLQYNFYYLIITTRHFKMVNRSKILLDNTGKLTTINNTSPDLYSLHKSSSKIILFSVYIYKLL